jgi:hypothetical protein
MATSGASVVGEGIGGTSSKATKKKIQTAELGEKSRRYFWHTWIRCGRYSKSIMRVVEKQKVKGGKDLSES